MTNQSTEQARLFQILFPYAYEQNEKARSEGFRFVHYTTADAAMKILRSKEVWMRKSLCMNDFLEVQYGLTRLSNTYSQTDTGKRLQAGLNALFPDIAAEVESLFNGWAPHFQTDTYFACLSEHEPTEDTFGRLSMWRAYDQGVGVALVLNNSVFVTPATGFGAYSSPVAYLDDNRFQKEMDRIVGNIQEEGPFLKELGREKVRDAVFHAFRSASVCTKHPGFAEEREWRIIYCPKLERSAYIQPSLEVINGVPQPVCKIPLKNFPEVGLDASVPNLLDHVIIGPSQFPWALAEAFHQLLIEAEVPNPDTKIRVSDIPLRR